MKSFNLLIIFRSLLAIVCVMLAGATFAQAPKTLSYQGKLSDAGGPLNGLYNLKFTIYDAASGGTSIWTETSNGIAVTGGNVSLTLGKITPIAVPTDKPMWLGITVNANSEISPRVEFTGSLYSLGLALPHFSSVNTNDISFHIQNNGAGEAGRFTMNNATSFSSAITGLIQSGRGAAGSFGNVDPTNFSPVLLSTTIGTGPAIFGRNQGGGSAGLFRIDEANNASIGLEVATIGTGEAGRFLVNNPANGAASVFASTNGTGSAITAQTSTGFAAINAVSDGNGAGINALNNGTGNGFAGSFSNTQATNTYPAIQAGTKGLAPGVRVIQDGSSIGSGMDIYLVNPASSAIGFALTQQGLGGGGIFNIDNTLNNQPALFVSTNGTGNAIKAIGKVEATQFIGDGSQLTGITGVQGPVGPMGPAGPAGATGATGATGAAGPSGWGLTGTSGTIDGTNFIGTTDNVPLNFRVANQNAGRIDLTLGNSSFGYLAASTNTIGSSNSAIGAYSLQGNTTGSFNIAFGHSALAGNTSGSNNIAIGIRSMQNGSSGQNNIALGFQSLRINTNGFSNIAIGGSTLTSNTTGNQNTAIGSEALFSNTTGAFNIAIDQALYTNTTGSNNIAIGYQSLNNNNASGNTAVGWRALLSNTVGSSSVALGQLALYSNTTGTGNVGIGDRAGYTFNGSNANTTGSSNTFIGYAAGPGTFTQLNNASAVGAGALVTASNMIRLGNASITVIQGQVGFTAASDQRFKKDIHSLNEGLDFILKLKPVSYKMKSDGGGKTNWGFIAQDIEKLLGTENAVLTIGGDEQRMLGLRYSDFVAPLTKAVQEQQQTIESLKAEIASMKTQHHTVVGKLEAENTQLKSDIESRLKKMETILGMKADATTTTKAKE